MDIPDGQPRFSIKATKDEPRCTDLHDVSWPTTPGIPLAFGADATIAVVIPSPLLRCVSCGRLKEIACDGPDARV